MFETILTTTLQPIITDVLVLSIFGFAGYIASKLPAKWRVEAQAKLLEIEAKHRATLHSGIDTATKVVLQSAIDKGGIDKGDITLMLRSLRGSAHDAIAKFELEDGKLIDMLVGNLKEKMLQLTGPAGQTTAPQPDTTKV
jgi:hypothetical protein